MTGLLLISRLSFVQRTLTILIAPEEKLINAESERGILSRVRNFVWRRERERERERAKSRAREVKREESLGKFQGGERLNYSVSAEINKTK